MHGGHAGSGELERTSHVSRGHVLRPLPRCLQILPAVLTAPRPKCGHRGLHKCGGPHTKKGGICEQCDCSEASLMLVGSAGVRVAGLAPFCNREHNLFSAVAKRWKKNFSNYSSSRTPRLKATAQGSPDGGDGPAAPT